MACAASERVKFKRVNLGKLSNAKKRIAWEWIKTNNPALAGLIQSPDMQQAKATFDGQIIVKLPEGLV